MKDMKIIYQDNDQIRGVCAWAKEANCSLVHIKVKGGREKQIQILLL